MRVLYTEEMMKMEKKIKPYRVCKGLEITLRPDTPKEIVELEEKLSQIFDERFEEAIS